MGDKPQLPGIEALSTQYYSGIDPESFKSMIEALRKNNSHEPSLSTVPNTVLDSETDTRTTYVAFPKWKEY